MVNDSKFLGLDMHADTISAAVLDHKGKVLLDKVIPTNAKELCEFVGLLRGPLYVALEEGTSAEWAYGLLQPLVTQVIVCNTRKLERHGNRSDRIDARGLAELLRCGALSPVYHQDCGLRGLEEWVRAYLALTQDQSRVMNRIKALYRSWGIGCSGQGCYGLRQRETWIRQLPDPAMQERARLYYEQMDSLRLLRQRARQQLLREGRRHRAFQRLCQIPYIGPLRAVVLIVFMQTPHRFRTKRQLWAYCGLGLETRDSGEFRFRQGKLQRKRRAPTVRGLNRDHCPWLKHVLKSAAMQACAGTGPLHTFAQRLLDQGKRPEMVRLTVARKLAAIVLVLWKKGVDFDPSYLTSQTA